MLPSVPLGATVPEAWPAIALVSIGALAARGAFLLFGLDSRIPARLMLWLDMLPSAAFAAMVVPAVLRPEGHLDLVSARSLAAVVALVVAWRSRSMTLTLVAGLAIVLVLAELG